MVRADPEGIAKPAGAIGQDLLPEYGRGALLLEQRQHHHLGFFQMSIAAHPAHHQFHSHVLRLQWTSDRISFPNTVAAPCCSNNGSTITSVSSRCPLLLTRPITSSTLTSSGCNGHQIGSPSRIRSRRPAARTTAAPSPRFLPDVHCCSPGPSPVPLSRPPAAMDI